MNFNGDVDQVIKADTVTQIIQTNRPLTRLERKEINNAVKDLSQRFGQAPWATWRTLHRVCGIEDVEQMHLGHLEPVRMILQLMVRACAAEGMVEAMEMDAQEEYDEIDLDSSLDEALRGQIRQLEKQLRAEKAQAQRFRSMQEKLMSESRSCTSCETLVEKRRNWQTMTYTFGVVFFIAGMVIGSKIS